MFKHKDFVVRANKLLIIFCISIFMAQIANPACITEQTDTSINYSTNGDFQTPYLGPGQYRFTSQPLYGWTATKIEQGAGSIYNARWGASQVIQLETDKLQEYKQIINVPQATSLQFKISYAARVGIPLASSGMILKWNGVVFRTVNPSLDYQIHTETFTLQANQGNNQIILQAAGVSDGAGMTCDNVIFYKIQNFNRVVVNGQCLCGQGYFDNHVDWNCQKCSSVQQVCLTCEYNQVPSTQQYEFKCLTCQDRYFSQNGVCVLCTSTLEGCTKCNLQGTICNSCNASTNHFTHPSNPSVCELCSLQGCTTCTSLTSCSVCNNTANYFLSSNNCQLCSLQGCTVCASLTVCTQRDCSIFQYTTGQVQANPSLCQCQTKFSWKANINRCQIQCNQIANALAIVPNSLNSCTCQDKFQWNPDTLACVIKCNEITNAVSNLENSNDQCICRQMYGWEISLQCVFQCNQISYTNGLKQGTENQCNCITGFLWDFNNLKCVIDCASISNALSVVEGTWSSCTCKSKFSWSNSASGCIIQCANINNTNGNLPGSLDQCRCKQGLHWNSTLQECIIDCSAVQFSSGLSQQSYTDCACKPNTMWRPRLKRCVLACQDIEYTLQAWTLPQDILCPCSQNFIWNSTTLQCEYNCTNVEKSLGYANEQAPDSCVCEQGLSWNNVELSCKVGGMDHLLGVFIGVGVVGMAGMAQYGFMVVKTKIMKSMTRVVPLESGSLVVG